MNSGQSVGGDDSDDYNEDGLTDKFLEVDPYTHIIWLSTARDNTYLKW